MSASHEYVGALGYEMRGSSGTQSGPGRPAWRDIEAHEAIQLVTAHHDHLGGRKALDNLAELTCGTVVVRRKRRRVKLSAAKVKASAEETVED